MNKDKPIIYIAGPYTKGDVAMNVKEAINVADHVLRFNMIPYIPHLTHFWHLTSPKRYEEWLEYDNVFLLKCDAVLRIPGESNGADKEVALATGNKIPVFYTFNELVRYFAEETKNGIKIQS